MAVEHVTAAPIEELSPSAGRDFPDGRLTLRDLHNVLFCITVELGRTQIKVRDVLALKAGSLVILDKYAGQLADITVNGLPMAKGEVVVIGDSINIRVADIAVGAAEGGGAHA